MEEVMNYKSGTLQLGEKWGEVPSALKCVVTVPRAPDKTWPNFYSSRDAGWPRRPAENEKRDPCLHMNREMEWASSLLSWDCGAFLIIMFHTHRVHTYIHG